MAVFARWLCVIGAVICAGCGESKETLETKRDLMHIGISYHNFHDARGRGPHNADELLAYEDPAARALPGNAATQSGTRKALQSGNYVVIWDVAIQTPGEKNSGKVLAYRRDVPEKGGAVCFQDAMVVVLTREEFEKAPKSQPAPSGSK